jgi:hypothetical protein
MESSKSSVAVLPAGNSRVVADEKRRKPPQSKTLARNSYGHDPREAFWSAPALWRFVIKITNANT